VITLFITPMRPVFYAMIIGTRKITGTVSSLGGTRAHAITPRKAGNTKAKVSAFPSAISRCKIHYVSSKN
jgi:hypothetical protein